ncbi:MAG TPA: cell division FtsA domain-containing protein, partial [Bacillota bacterium]|nr:cell division FtsA domain-containing protein [Bacillota bacterium]
YQCVGYTVVYYQLNNQRMRNLIGQRGEKISLEILATFLPREVVDSLFAVLDRTGMEMASLTLEPIAASEVVIPESMRQLSVALVDVGAGTSDIALCSDGTMTAYAMVPEAGDEITEILADRYLLDFNEAERLKRQVNQGGALELTDILGVKQTIDAEVIKQELLPRVTDLVGKIAEKIVLLSYKPVQAVMCIGGGSLSPGFPQALAKALNLPEARVAVRGREVVNDVTGDDRHLIGPDSITPLGIGVTAHRGHGLGFLRVTVNGRPIRLFKLNEGTVGDALLVAGIDTKMLYGRPGLSLSFTVNGEFRVVKGTIGNPADIFVNGMKADLETRIGQGDAITVEEAVPGKDAYATIREVLKDYKCENWVTVDDERVDMGPYITMNEQRVELDKVLTDLARITVYVPDTVEEALVRAGKSNLSSLDIVCNGQPVSLAANIACGDVITTTPIFYEITETVPAREQDAEESNDLDQRNNPDQVGISEGVLSEVAVGVEAEPVSNPQGTSIMVNGEPTLISRPSGKFAVYDVLGQMDFSARPPFTGAELKLEVNGEPASFTTLIKADDSVVIEWK